MGKRFGTRRALIGGARTEAKLFSEVPIGSASEPRSLAVVRKKAGGS